jgi:hypothetical protein
MELTAFHLTQSATVKTSDFYVTSIQAIELIERCAIDRWTPGNTRGYQRLPQKNRFKTRPGTIVRYLTKDLGCFPTSILVNVRDKPDIHYGTGSGLVQPRPSGDR